MTAGSLSLSYIAPGTFTAIVTAPAGYNVQSVTLNSPSNSPYSMNNTTYGMNPSTWTCMAGGGPGGAQPGNWTATATLMATATSSGSVTV